MTEAVLGWGTLFQTRSFDSPDVWVTVAEVMNISPPAPSRDVLDLSTGNAPDEWRTSEPGMPDAGEISIEFNFIPTGNSPSDHDYYSALKEEFDDKVVRRRRIVFPDGETMEFDAYITELTSQASAESQLKATAKFRVTGEIGAII